MCILFTAINQHPLYPVIICANRDEFHHRPTQAMHRWKSSNAHEHIIAGKDLQAGGTWLGINSKSRTSEIIFSALTNYRLGTANPEKKQFTSRGELVTRSLRENHDKLLPFLKQHSTNYQGFNLIYGQLSPTSTQLFCFDSVKKDVTSLSEGFHSICNGALDDIWPKMAIGKENLEQYVSQERHIDVEALFSLMNNTVQAPYHLLPNTGIPLAWEQRLSSIFITSPEYGTRSTCILLMNNQGGMTISQQEYNPLGNVITKECFSF